MVALFTFCNAEQITLIMNQRDGIRNVPLFTKLDTPLQTHVFKANVQELLTH